MESAPRALEVKATEGYRVWVRFEDGLEAVVDFSDMVALVGYYTDPLRDLDYFQKVDIYPGGHGIFWPNECDVCPDRLYELAQEAAGVAA
jgi:hypothetical protein